MLEHFSNDFTKQNVYRRFWTLYLNSRLKAYCYSCAVLYYINVELSWDWEMIHDSMTHDSSRGYSISWHTLRMQLDDTEFLVSSQYRAWGIHRSWLSIFSDMILFLGTNVFINILIELWATVHSEGKSLTYVREYIIVNNSGESHLYGHVCSTPTEVGWIW
jgi:hypothetical protein